MGRGGLSNGFSCRKQNDEFRRNDFFESLGSSESAATCVAFNSCYRKFLGPDPAKSAFSLLDDMAPVPA